MLNELKRFSLLMDSNDKAGARNVISVLCDDICSALDANVVDVRFYYKGEGGNILGSFVSTGRDAKDTKMFIVNTNPSKENKTGLWSWLVKNKNDIWIKDIPENLGNDPLKNEITGDSIPIEYTNISPKTRSILVTSYFRQKNLWGILSIELGEPNRFNNAMVGLFSEITKHIQIIIKKTHTRSLKQKDTDKAINLFCDKIKRFNLKRRIKSVPTGFFSRPFSSEYNIVEDCLAKIFKENNIVFNSFMSDTSKGIITDRIINRINYDNFGIVDISGLKANVMIELGYLINSNIELLIIKNYSDEFEIPFNIKGHQCYLYKIEHPEPNIQEMKIHSKKSGKWNKIDSIVKPLIKKIKFC